MNYCQQLQTNISKYQHIWTDINTFNQLSINIVKYEHTWININKYRNKSTNINKYQQISTNMNKHQGNKYEQIWTNRPIAFLLNSHYVKTMWKASHGSPNQSAEQSQEQKSIKHKSKSININMIQIVHKGMRTEMRLL